MSYKQSLLQSRQLADKIISGEYSKEKKVQREEKSQGLVARPPKGSEELGMEETPDQGLDMQEMMASYMMALRQKQAPAENTSEPRQMEDGTPRPVSRGDVAKNAGRRLMTDLMKDFGLTREQAAGFVGNLDHETGGFKFMQEITPVVPGSRGGFGFAQWTGPRRKQFEAWAGEKGLDLESYEANYGFLKHELENTPEGRVLNKLRETGDVKEATTVVSKDFLRPGKPHLESRISRASRYLEDQA